MRLPPRSVRRIVLWPLPGLAVVLYLVTVPLLVIAALLVSYRLPGKLRAVRSLGLATCYLFIEAAVTVVALVTWLISGFGWKLSSPRFVAIHYACFRWALRALVIATQRLFSLEIEVPPGWPTAVGDSDVAPTDAPLLVMSRHAGPADSLLLLDEVMSWKGRRPRIVADAALQLDPALDILMNRLPNYFIPLTPPPGGGTVPAIAALAAGMSGIDAFVIFPEGENFTEARRTRAIARLRASGLDIAADRAAALRNVLPPRPAGSLAAIAACPEADVVFVAHTGLDQIATFGDLWTAIPDHKVIELAWRVVPAREIPDHDEGRIELLYQAWEGIDAWIERRKQQERTARAKRAPLAYGASGRKKERKHEFRRVRPPAS